MSKADRAPWSVAMLASSIRSGEYCRGGQVDTKGIKSALSSVGAGSAKVTDLTRELKKAGITERDIAEITWSWRDK